MQCRHISIQIVWTGSAGEACTHLDRRLQITGDILSARCTSERPNVEADVEAVVEADVEADVEAISSR